MVDRSDHARTGRQLALAWLALSLGALLLAARYPHLPDVIPAYRTLSGSPSHLLAKNAFSVFRIVAMGIGQLGAATVMARQAAHTQQGGWSTFWGAAAMAAGAKTLIESVQYARIVAAGGPLYDAGFMLAALLPVALFLALALRLWRAGSLEPQQPMSSRSKLSVAAFLLLWLVCAALPRWLTG